MSFNSFLMAQSQFNEVAVAFFSMSQSEKDFLCNPMRELVIRFCVKMDNGEGCVLEGYRVRHNTALGPAKGGIRWYQSEDLDTIRALAMWMSWKCALSGLPLGGGKGGIRINPKKLSLNEKERVARAYIKAIGHDIGTSLDVPAPDINTDSQIMAWMMDEFEAMHGCHAPGVITGKPLRLGGSLGRVDATSRGGVFVIEEISKVYGFDFKDKDIIIQGYGNAGFNAATLFHSILGVKVIAIGNSRAAVYAENGLNLEDLNSYYRSTGTLSGYMGAQEIDKSEFLYRKCDLLILATIEGVLDGDNAHRVNAKFILELANGPITPEADSILEERGTVVIPDLLANAGGVIVSYFEQIQNAQFLFWTEDEVYRKLKDIIKKSFYSVYETMQFHKTSMRKAALSIGIRRVREASLLRGWI